MEARRKRGNWLLLSAFFAFALPASLIGFLAMGMVAGQKKIRESELRDSWNREIAQVSRRLEAEVDRRVQELFRSAASGFTPVSDRPAFLEALKGLFVAKRDVSYPFLFSTDGVLVLPRFGNSRQNVGSGWMEKWSPPVSDSLWRQAEHVEFSTKDPLRAIPFYLALEKRVPRQTLPDLYLAVCRCYFKAGKMIQAREYGLAAMERLATAPLRRDRLDLYVLRQLGLVSMQMDLPQEAFSYYLRLYEALASRPDELAPDLQFLRWEALDFLKNNRDIQPFLKKERIREIDRQVLELYRGEISLYSDLAAPVPAADFRLLDRDRFLKLKEIFDPETRDTLFYRSVAKRFPSWRTPPGDHAVHFRSGVFQQSPFLLAFARIPDRADGSSFYFGCKFHLQELASTVWPALRAPLRLPRGTALVLSGPDGKPLPASENPAGKESVLAVPGRAALAGWTFQLLAADSRFFSNLAAKALRWYYILIALLFISLALGVFLLVRYFGREKELLRQKADFVDMTSHTLKTPLTRLRLMAEKLEQGWTAEPERSQDQCRAIVDETANMAQLVDRMLDFSVLQAGRASYFFGNRIVREWLGEVLQKFKLPLEEKRFQLELDIVEGIPPVCIDPEAMGTALSNLVENALQHAAAGRYLGIAATARGGNLELAITDRGPGISRKDQDRLFEPFFRGHDQGKRRDSGKGLGLAISRGIVEAHGGSIRVESGERGGTRFVITLPFAGE